MVILTALFIQQDSVDTFVKCVLLPTYASPPTKRNRCLMIFLHVFLNLLCDSSSFHLILHLILTDERFIF